MANKEYIERNALLKDIDSSIVFTVRSDLKHPPEIRGANKVIDRIKVASTADVEPVRHGEWQEITTHNGCTYDYDCVCSICGKSGIPSYDFCPHCGAKMDLKEKDK